MFTTSIFSPRSYYFWANQPHVKIIIMVIMQKYFLPINWSTNKFKFDNLAIL